MSHVKTVSRWWFETEKSWAQAEASVRHAGCPKLDWFPSSIQLWRMLMCCLKERVQRASGVHPETTTPASWIPKPTAAASSMKTPNQMPAFQRSVHTPFIIMRNAKLKAPFQRMQASSPVFGYNSFPSLFVYPYVRGGVSPAAFASAMERAVLTTSWFTGSPARSQRRGRFLSVTSGQRAYRWRRR